jgi:hypothetical protein
MRKNCSLSVAATHLISRWREYLASPKAASGSAFGPTAFLQDGRWADHADAWNEVRESNSRAARKPNASVEEFSKMMAKKLSKGNGNGSS